MITRWCLAFFANVLVCLSADGADAGASPPDLWVLTSESPDVDPRYAATLANGWIGQVVPALGTTTQEENSGHYFLDGFYQGASPHEAKVQIPRWNCIGYHDGRSLCRPGVGTVSDYRQQLDLRHGTVETRFVWTDGDRSTAIHTRTFVSRADSHLAVVSYEVTPDFDGPIALHVGLDGRNQAGRLHESGAEADMLWMRSDLGSPTDLRAGVAVQASFSGPELAAEVGPPSSPNTPLPLLARSARFQACKSRTYAARAYVAVCKSGDSQELEPSPPDVAAAAREKARQAASVGEDALYADHCRAWDNLWQTEIRIDGDGPEVIYYQRVIRACLFTLLQSVRPAGVFGQDSLGFTQSGWDGAVFWDDNFYVFPVRQFLYPALAMPSLRYRTNRLAAARAHAASLGCEGAAFPWQSRYDGRENSKAPYNREVHISGEVVWAQWLHYQSTHDTRYLRETGWPLIREVANFVASRSVERRGRYEVLQVVSPDEYTPIIDNDVFTNAIFRRVLEIAGQAAAVLGEKPDPRWDAVARGMWLPFDETSGVYPEYEGYTGKRTKQAGVELLLFPLEVPMSNQVKRRILDYYGARVDREHGPGMTASFYTIGYSEMGDTQRAYQAFGRGIDPYLRSPFYLYSETPTNDSTDFITSKASTLLAVIHGFAGVRIRDDGVHFHPRLPPGWRGLKFTHLPIGQAVYDVDLDATGEVRAKLVTGTPNIPLSDSTGKNLDR